MVIRRHSFSDEWDLRRRRRPAASAPLARCMRTNLLRRVAGGERIPRSVEYARTGFAAAGGLVLLTGMFFLFF